MAGHLDRFLTARELAHQDAKRPAYVAVQMPSAFLRSWRWSDWSYDTSSGQILGPGDRLLPMNYFVISVSRNG